MDHSFEVGKTYRNRSGAYVVLGFEGPKMLVRFEDGSKKKLTIAVQTQIWRNIHDQNRSFPKKIRKASKYTQKGGGRSGSRIPRYENVCWSCKAPIDSIYCQQCAKCKGYKCSDCYRCFCDR